MNIKVLKPEEVNKMIVLHDEITSLLEQNLLYRKVFLIKKYCRKNCGKDCTVCPRSKFYVAHELVEFSEFDESKHYSTKESAEQALKELQQKLEPIYQKIAMQEPKEIDWYGQGHEAEAYCPTCEEYLGEDQDLALNPIEKCPRCGQRFTEE